jgi:hypothetical protein
MRNAVAVLDMFLPCGTRAVSAGLPPVSSGYPLIFFKKIRISVNERTVDSFLHQLILWHLEFQRC